MGCGGSKETTTAVTNQQPQNITKTTVNLTQEIKKEDEKVKESIKETVIEVKNEVKNVEKSVETSAPAPEEPIVSKETPPQEPIAIQQEPKAEVVVPSQSEPEQSESTPVEVTQPAPVQSEDVVPQNEVEPSVAPQTEATHTEIEPVDDGKTEVQNSEPEPVISNAQSEVVVAESSTLPSPPPTTSPEVSSPPPPQTTKPPSSLPPKPHSGWLTKQGHLIRNWKRRYFTLDGGVLKYFVAENLSDLKGELPLKNMMVIQPEANRILLQVQPGAVFPENEPKPSDLLMESSSAADAAVWVRVLNEHIQHANRITTPMRKVQRQGSIWGGSS